jgi:hypothetical protein
VFLYLLNIENIDVGTRLEACSYMYEKACSYSNHVQKKKIIKLPRMNTDYLKSAKQQFLYYKQLGDKTMDQLNDEQLFWQYKDASNSIAIMVKHLWGNMMSRWTDFLTTDGEKDFRQRDEEFELRVGPSLQGVDTANAEGVDTDNAEGVNEHSRAVITEKWEQGWACLFTALDSINEDNFDTTIYIRNQGHSIPEAINRQMMHYAYHVGQIVYLGRMMKGEDWQSLSIPKGNSKAYNAEKFSQEKGKRHFTDEYLGKS